MALRGLVQKYKSGDVPKNVKDDIVRQRLKRKCTPASVDFLMSDKKRKRSNKYTNEDFKIGYKLLVRGKKTLDLVRKLVPTAVPSPCLVQRKFNFMSLLPGICIHIRTYINVHLKHTEAFENNGHLVGICCDEIYLNKIGMYYGKFDLAIRKTQI